MYLSTIAGFLIALFSVYSALMAEGGSISSMVNGPAAAIVFIGAAGAALMGTTFGNLLSIPMLMLQAIMAPKYNPAKPTDLVNACMRMSDKARQFGLPSLTSEIPVAVDEFMQRGIKLLVAGTEAKTVSHIMHEEIERIALTRWENVDTSEEDEQEHRDPENEEELLTIAEQETKLRAELDPQKRHEDLPRTIWRYIA